MDIKIVFASNVVSNKDVENRVSEFLKTVRTLEHKTNSPIVISQDGKTGGYYIKCSIPANIVCGLLNVNARLDPGSTQSYRANRELLLKHRTYQKMKSDAAAGREFHDIIVEYTKEYDPDRPLKVWGGQHRSKAIQEAFDSKKISKYHGFRVYFCLDKDQRTDLALISNTNISVSNDLFDRQVEETLVGTKLREWCVRVGLLKNGDDFPDQASRSERISVKLARTFIVNFLLGREQANKTSDKELDKNIYEPYLCESGVDIDPEYQKIIDNEGTNIWLDKNLIRAGEAFSELNRAQREAVEKEQGIEKRKSFKNKALTASVLAGWSYVAGLLQKHQERLNNLYCIPPRVKECPDPLNAKGMSIFHHAKDEATYRGLGTRSALKDRQRMAQVFLAKSLAPNVCLDKKLLNQAVSQVIAIQTLEGGYSKF
jgi:hypothetical protein